MNQIVESLKSERVIEKFHNVAPEWMSHDAEYGFALQLLSANDYLMKIALGNKESLLHAMANVAACGLSLNPAKKEAYFVPRKGKVCLDPSYMGLVKLATDTGAILWVQSKLVHDNDDFTTNGVDEKPSHKVNPFGERGKIVGVYTVAKTKDGDYLTETMSIDDVYAIRDRSEAYKSNPNKTPWATDAGEMIKKTCTKRASKMWPRSGNVDAESRLAKAIQTSHESDDITLTTSAPDLGQYTDEAKTYFDQLLTNSDALGMYVLAQTTPQTEYNNLYHSFEKGQKGKYQRLVDGLNTGGFGMFTDYLNNYREALESGDDLGVKQIEEEISQEAFQLLKDRS